MSPAPTVEARRVTKKRVVGVDAGTKKNERLVSLPGLKSDAKNRRKIAVMVDRNTPAITGNRAAGRRNSRRRPAAMIVHTRCQRGRRGVSRRGDFRGGGGIQAPPRRGPPGSVGER